MVDVESAPGVGTVYLVASGDARHTANVAGWPAQQQLEQAIIAEAARHGVDVVRGHAYDERHGHGFIASQRQGFDVFADLDPDGAVIVAESIWQFSHNVLGALLHHRGPILTIGNWSGQWPGLVGLLNLNASLAKAGRAYSTLWTETFDDDFFVEGLRTWLDTGAITHDESHVSPFDPSAIAPANLDLGTSAAEEVLHRKAIIGVFDEGCMGMYNAILDDHFLNPTGIFKERLSQSALLAEMASVTDEEAAEVRWWLTERGFTFETGPDHATDLTDDQLTAQMKMYVAAGRMAERYDCDAIGIQYQLGLIDMAPASDLVEGLLNNIDRPPIRNAETGQVIRDGEPIPHFNEVDEGIAVDLIATNGVWRRLDLDPSATLHDVRWGEDYDLDTGTEFVWTFMISGSVPASHIDGGYGAARSVRQPPMYFKNGGGTLSGTSKAGDVVWSRVYQLPDGLHADIGLASAVDLPDEETQRRLDATTPEWPIMHAVLHGVSRDQFMARHKSNHVTVAYADDPAGARAAMEAKAAMFDRMGITVHTCGV